MSVTRHIHVHRTIYIYNMGNYTSKKIANRILEFHKVSEKLKIYIYILNAIFRLQRTKFLEIQNIRQNCWMKGEKKMIFTFARYVDKSFVIVRIINYES